MQMAEGRVAKRGTGAESSDKSHNQSAGLD